MHRNTQPEHDLRWFVWKEWASDLPQGENSQDQQQKRGLVACCVEWKDLNVEFSYVNVMKLGLSLLLGTDVFTVTFKTGAEHIPILISGRFPFL